ncbi:MAG TPA: filamentous hemagglutinin N-terminal domain-containing protein, partial [Burkholderiales bacterium]|nr:filamentous hemagglutinin N-terminal domain-containing protein [Burkholderiales bacterium]
MRPVESFIVSLALSAAVVWPAGSAAQAITADGTLGTVVANGGDNYTISGGTVKGLNLFHSFGQFNVPTLGSAIFDGPGDTQNVLSRVTGGMPSTIDGFISTRGGESPMWSANFYLINPNGVVFGPNAFVDVGGAFHASTADYIRLADETIFSAAPAMGEVLTSAPPQAFGFLSSNPASIILDGSVLFVDPPADADTPGQTLSLVGGDVQLLGGAALFAPGGLARIISVGSPGVVDLSSQDLGLGSFSRLGQVTISEFGGITAGGADFGVPGGTVMIRSGQLVLDTGAILLSDTADFPAAVLGIDIDARESVTIRDGAAVQTFSAGPADASGISITAGSLTVGDGGLIESFAFSDGKTGPIDISVGSVQILSGG